MDDLRKLRIGTSSMMLRRHNEGDEGMVIEGTHSVQDTNEYIVFATTYAEVKAAVSAGRPVFLKFPAFASLNTNNYSEEYAAVTAVCEANEDTGDPNRVYISGGVFAEAGIYLCDIDGALTFEVPK